MLFLDNKIVGPPALTRSIASSALKALYRFLKWISNTSGLNLKGAVHISCQWLTPLPAMYCIGQFGFTMRSQQVQRAWDAIIEEHLEPQQIHGWKVYVEIRSDNGPQFCAKVVQEYFKENYLNQVFTHPYTPQENGHIESFHNILSNSLDGSYWSLEMLENRLETFYYIYNVNRVHSSCAYLPPELFWRSWNANLVSRTLLKNRTVCFRLNVKTQLIPGILRLRETSCQNRAERTAKNKCEGTVSTFALNLTPVNPLSSVTSCIAK